MLKIQDRKIISLAWGTRAIEITPQLLRFMADQLEEAMQEGYFVTSDVSKWNDQDGVNYPETLTHNGAGPSITFEIHLGRLSITNPNEGE